MLLKVTSPVSSNDVAHVQSIIQCLTDCLSVCLVNHCSCVPCRMQEMFRMRHVSLSLHFSIYVSLLPPFLRSLPSSQSHCFYLAQVPALPLFLSLALSLSLFHGSSTSTLHSLLAILSSERTGRSGGRQRGRPTGDPTGGVMALRSITLPVLEHTHTETQIQRDIRTHTQWGLGERSESQKEVKESLP